ncbi:NADPH flavin oxidoreductase [Malacoplasma penetrans HF-2]|uniref:NADPH flavin oxidoreductase n=1 Tax=Malacoplasma penetrans (strain HF-2) TaxID=272633 RepID=Q8EVC3_MALP2|nr:nitroreductase family protein [Malacoplasma penetrans]BAC44433.1 NADPH flavin oxidoreductase [Malacoplasma penetrans HF-2]
MQVIENILKRRLERNYKNTAIEQEKIDYLIKVINSSPTSTNSQDFSAIIVEDKELRQKISMGLETQSHIVNAPLFIIFCADNNRLNHVALKENKEIRTDNLNNFLTASGDAFIAASFAYNAALQLGLGACYIGMVRASLEAIKETLNLEGNIVPIIGLTIGYIESQNEIKPKINHVYKQKYNINQLKQEVDVYDKDMLTYYDSRNANAKNSTWSQTCLNPFINGTEKAAPVDAFIKKTWGLK